MIKIYLLTDVDGYVSITSSTSLRNENEQTIEVSKDHEVLRNSEIFKYVDGKLIKDVDKQRQLKAEANDKPDKLTDDEMNAIAIMELSEKIMNIEMG
ncbi:hypothetical protein JOC34_000433 [Virgibacillus halotolerans]|uniref:hypothetical protein n=1 Tax=Virgibacillus halotolerans TaxID=1071053 RepID=UPI00195FC007|nr:hypothetical protein [Virgibacillus halotolerans]MBM7598076.1 hypothetical protein [Virgibacillus halotolerans]